MNFRIKRQIVAFCLFLFLLSACVTATPATFEGEVENARDKGEFVLLEPTFAQELLRTKLSTPLLVEFYTDWCKVCQGLERPLQQAARDGKDRFIVAKVDVSGQEELMETFGLQAQYPAFILKIPDNPELIEKYGSNEFSQLLTWLKDTNKASASPLQFAQEEKRTGYKAVLIAGSSENANFVQELSWFQRLLAERGIRDEEIACFAAVPDLIQYHADREQFDALAPFIRTCRPARRDEILATIQSSINQKPSDFYVYITSHGAEPAAEENRDRYRSQCISQAPALALDQSEEGCHATQDMTPDALAAVMMNADSTKKHVILQGCYTGGFISMTRDPENAPSSLAALPNITIMTASRPDRASFGCNPGSVVTVYGYAIMRTIAGHQTKMENMPWHDIAKEVEKVVTEEEKRFQISSDKGSEPQFFQRP